MAKSLYYVVDIKKPFYQGDPMAQKNGQWYVIHQGEWLEFAGLEKEIIWK